MPELVAGATNAQRQWILDRDQHRCQHYSFDGVKWIRCRNTSNLQVHHVVARYWSTRHLPTTFHVNGPYNLITLCRFHHIGSLGAIHADTYKALLAFGKGNKQAFDAMNKRRRELTEKGIPYWDTSHDWSFHRIMKRLNVDMLKRTPYPSSGVRGVTGRTQPPVK